jgi:hypothetical protein
MIGKRASQGELFDVGNVYPLSLPPSSFHAQLAKAASRLFKDEEFATIYSDKRGRPSVPPSLLALTLLLQNQAKVSDEEAIFRTAYDLRWAAVLGRFAGEPLCAKSTLQLFRGQLIIHEEARTVFLASIKEAKRAGLLKGQALMIALDTKPIDGKGAVEDTYNLLATGIRQLAKAFAKSKKENTERWMRKRGLIRYTESSIKGSADIDWSDPNARNIFLEGIVKDARHLLSMASKADDNVLEASDLLMRLLLQDIEEPEPGGGVHIKEGTTRNRIPSATDPEQRHGRKSKSKTFVGSKASIATDIESQIIVATDVIPGNAGDASRALSLVEQAESNTGIDVSESIGDCAYGGGETRQEFADSDRKLTAKVPMEKSNGDLFPKSAFTIDLENNTVICPAGKIATKYEQMLDGRKSFRFEKLCASCSLRNSCTRSSRGRFLSVHPQEKLLGEAREYQQTSEGRAHMRERVAVEHALARLSHLGIGQARYIGLAKTQFQLMMAAAVANFRRTWNWEEFQMRPQETSGLVAHELCEQQSALLAGSVRIILHILSRFVWAADRAIPQLVRSLAA